MIRRHRAGIKTICTTLAAVFCLLAGCISVRAETVIEVPPRVQVIDLSVHGALVQAEKPNIAIELPETPYMKRTLLGLDATGPGPSYTWTVYTVRNTSGVRRELVLAIDPQRLSGSNLFPVKPFGRKARKVISTLPPDLFASRASGMQDAYAFELPADAAMAIAIEGDAPIAGIRLYDDAAYTKRETSIAFLRGAALTVTLVLTLFIIGLYSVRSHAAFVAGAIVALSCLQFMALESGYLDRFSQGIFSMSFDLQQLRAWSEALLAFSLGLAAWGLSTPNATPRRSMLWVAALFVLFCAVAVLGWFDPALGSAVARILVVAATAGGFLLALDGWRNDTGAMSMGMTLWATISSWVMFAVLVTLGPYQAPASHAALLAGLATVVAILAFALARLALEQGYMSNAYLTKSASRSLALAGGRHVLFDWRPNDNRLFIGDELAAELGHDPVMLQGPDAARMFLALVHPGDQISYQRALSIHTLSPGELVETELRVQGTDGQYRWFALRFAAVSGAGNRAERAVGTLTDITEKKRTEGRLASETARDAVTGLPNRAIFNERLEHELSKTIGLPVRVMLIGLARFKYFNDGLGHDLGDQILLAAGQRISECLLPDETLSRLSGGMFAVLYVEAIDKRSAETLAKEILGRLSLPLPVAGQEAYLTASIGISQPGVAGASATALHDQAVRALYAAQARARPSYLVFDESMRNEKAAEVALEVELRRGLDRGEIEVHYQPIVELASRTIMGFEALARWRHRDLGYLPPSEFIAIAEQAGLLGEISAIVLAESARQLGVWLRTQARNRKLYVAVNISAEQMTDPGLFDRISATLERESLPPSSLAVEITESVAMRFPERARQLFAKLKGAGVSVSCDDFGTGFSNLASLRDLNFNTLKVDRSFVTEGGLDGRGGVILGSVIGLAHELGMKVVAEGIESEEQTIQLEEMGVDLGQGFWLGEPMSALDVPALLAVLPAVEHEPTSLERGEAPDPGQAPLAPRPSERFMDLRSNAVTEAIRQIVSAAEVEAVRAIEAKLDEDAAREKAEAAPASTKRKRKTAAKAKDGEKPKEKAKPRPRKQAVDKAGDA